MTALSACIFLPLLFCPSGVFTLPLQKPQMLFDRPRMEIFKNVLPCTFLNYEFFSGKTRFCLTPLTSCQYEFDISSNSLSSVVQGRAMLDSGYRFNRCPKNLLYIHIRISPYRRNWLWRKNIRRFYFLLPSILHRHIR